MHNILWRFAIALAASTASLPALAQPAAPTAISAKVGKPWLHKATGIALPATIDGFARGEILDLSNGPQLDVSIAYDDPIGRTHVNIYIYHAADPSTALWFDVAATMIATNDKFGMITPHSGPIPFTINGANVAAGLRQSFAVTQIGRSSGVALIGLGEWVVKLRMTSPVYDSAQLDGAMDRMMQQVGWPKKLPPLGTATPLPPCAQPRSFGPPAEKAKQDDAAMLLGAMMGSLVTDNSRKTREKGEAPSAPALCVLPDRIGGRLPIYQREGENAGYVIPLGDSGILLDVSQDSLAGLLTPEKDKDASPAPWSVTVKRLDRWLQYPSYATLPPPSQAIDIFQKEKPLSSTSIYGKGGTRISISPDAVKKD
ncbi:hypothetical protein [Sphingobium sp. YR768]|uniref:hypothetical protein n=1 Tax=Sphingobium sp. YR768 TaxID=1884365 RepID=UPI0008C4A20C|nr:hypothetical protein [Sphingobium sp. YR768]SES18562.1 hypothetical protein SAMN05518866_1552 [Sphingobium sp. YR768]